MKFRTKYNSYRFSHGDIDTIKFEDGVYETEDTKEIEALKNHKLFNEDFFELSQADEEALEKAKSESKKAVKK